MRNRIYTMSRSYTYYDYTYRNVFKINNLFNLLPPSGVTNRFFASGKCSQPIWFTKWISDLQTVNQIGELYVYIYK